MAIENKRVLISGAGIAGPALAGRLLRYGFTPTLIERAPAFREGGYMIDVWGTGYDVLEKCGLLQAAESKAYHFDQLTFVDASGRRLAGFGGAVFRRALGDRFFSVPRGDLARAIYDPIKDQVETLFGTTIESLAEDESGVDVVLSTGGARRFDLVIGTDGLRSRVRERVFGADAEFEKYLGYYAASFIAPSYPHRDEAAYVSFAKPGRQISRYAMREGRSAFLFVFATDRKAIHHDMAAQKALLHAWYDKDGWETPEILAALDRADDLYFDAVSQIRMPHWSRGRVALVGDAAHSPSLLAGAGSAYAMLGAYVLAGELAAASGDHSRAFPAYEARLKDYIRRQQDVAAGFAGSFTPRTALGVWARNAVVNLMRVPLINTWLMRRMLGENYAPPEYPAS
jgi:2-polyprenyl-6-methoxyphenol hydroxylase-like FAD-dependent oxidoreductase